MYNIKDLSSVSREELLEKTKEEWIKKFEEEHPQYSLSEQDVKTIDDAANESVNEAFKLFTSYKTKSTEWNTIWDVMRKDLNLDSNIIHIAEKTIFIKFINFFKSPIFKKINSVINFCATFSWCIKQEYIKNDDVFIETIKNESSSQPWEFVCLLAKSLNIEDKTAKGECLKELIYYIFDMFKFNVLYWNKFTKIDQLLEEKIEYVNSYLTAKEKQSDGQTDYPELRLNQRVNFLDQFRKKYNEKMAKYEDLNVQKALESTSSHWAKEKYLYDELKSKKTRAKRIFYLKIIAGLGVASLLAGGVWYYKYRKK